MDRTTIIRLIASVLLALLLYGCDVGTGVNASLNGSSESTYRANLDTAWQSMTKKQKDAFNYYANQLQSVAQFHQKYGVTTAKRFVEREAQAEISAATNILNNIAADFPAVKQFYEGLAKFEARSPTIAFISGDQGEMQAKIEFELANLSEYEYRCFVESELDWPKWGYGGENDIPFKLSATVSGNDGRGIVIYKYISELGLNGTFNENFGPNLCKSMPSPGKSKKITWTRGLGNIGGDLPTAEHMNRVGVKELSLEFIDLALMPKSPSAVPAKAFFQYVTNALTIAAAKRRIQAMQ